MRCVTRFSPLVACVFLAVACAMVLQIPEVEGAPSGADVELPRGVRAVWDASKAYRESTSTRERICINGLWRFKPAGTYSEGVPAAGTGWGYFKVPGAWPGKGGESQTLYASESWGVTLGSLDAVWSARDITVPADWRGRRIGLRVENLNSYATVFVDGREVGSIVFPGGDLDITSACSPGKTHQLAVRTIAQRLNPEGTNYVSGEAKTNNWTPLSYRGLCGDVFLTSGPPAERITDVKVDTSVRKWRLTVDAGLVGLEEGKSYTLLARVVDDGKDVLTAHSEPFTSADLKNGRMAFEQAWETPKLWDTDTPENMYHLTLELAGAVRTLDAYYPVRFGFREFWIEGRDFILNGSPVHLRAVPLNSAMRGPVGVLVSYEGARETLSRIKWLGFNAVYGHNYRCTPGSHVSYADVLRAADDIGMLFCFSMPHMNSYDWRERDEKTNGYERHMEWYVRRAQNHPSVVMYAQNHNFLFVRDIHNPERLPLVLDKDPLVASRRTDLIYSRERILRQFDTTRPVYNHGGWSRELYTMNSYLNWTPMQERADWLGRWAEKGVRPLFAVEFGEPTSLTFMAYRGEGEPVLHQFFLPEWGSAIWGDVAFKLSEFEKGALRFETDRWRKNEPFMRWAYPREQLRSTDLANLKGVQAEFVRHTWPYFRTFGISGFNIWSELGMCYLVGDIPRRVDYEMDWDDLQRPGFNPDYCANVWQHGLFYTLATKASAWLPNVCGRALLRYNQPLLAYIAGGPSRFTAKDHNYLPGQTVEKQIIVINDSRRTVDCASQWSISLPESQGGEKSVRVEPGRNGRVLVRFTLPDSTPPGAYEFAMKVSFSTGEVQEDSFVIHVLPRPDAPKVSGKIALYDPKGETAALLSKLGIAFDGVGADADLGAHDILVIGKGALTVDGPAPDLSRVRDGLKVVMFEQTSEALERRLGFRVQEFGMRRAFTRVAGHPILDGLSSDNLRDWHGEATLLPPTLPLPKLHAYQMVEWCGFEVRRFARCGHYGNVSSVMIEKPGAGDFLPLMDCGFGLQYSPLMEYREGRGMVLFCQVDVTGRTGDDPASVRLAGNIMEYVDAYTPPPSRRAVYAGEPAGLEHLKAAGVAATAYEGQPLREGQVLVVGPAGGAQLSAHADQIGRWVERGGHVLALGLSEQEAQAFLPFKVRMQVKEHISSYFEPRQVGTLLSGVGCGDVLVRGPREQPLVVGGADIVGNGVLAQAEGANVVFCQLVPWHYDYEKFYNMKTTFRRSSFAVTRLLGNMGAAFDTPLLSRFGQAPGVDSKPWLEGLYLDEPVAQDDPYRYYCW